MKRSNLFKKAAWAFLMLAGLFTFASCSNDEEEDYKGSDSTVVNNTIVATPSSVQKTLAAVIRKW